MDFESSKNVEVPEGAEGKVYDVLVTGFGPWNQYKENPSWLAVKPLRNTTLIVHPNEIQAPSSLQLYPNGPMIEPLDPKENAKTRYIRISTLCIPMEYDAVQEITPSLHLRPPILPEEDDDDSSPPNPPPPRNGFDFIFHIGVAGRGDLRVEKMAHKLGYNMKDGKGKYAPEVKTRTEYEYAANGNGNGTPQSPSTENGEIIDMQIGEPRPPSHTTSPGHVQSIPPTNSYNGTANNHHPQYNGVHTQTYSPPFPHQQNYPPNYIPPSALHSHPSTSDYHFQPITAPVDTDTLQIGSPPLPPPVGRPTRGCTGYDKSPEDLFTEVDIFALIADIKQQGFMNIYSSMDAGHYLSDFLYYCSLASSVNNRQKLDIRNASPFQLSRIYDQQHGHHHTQTPVLFMHCPPVGRPLTSEEVTDAIRRILKWVVGGL